MSINNNNNTNTNTDNNLIMNNTNLISSHKSNADSDISKIKMLNHSVESQSKSNVSEVTVSPKYSYSVESEVNIITSSKNTKTNQFEVLLISSESEDEADNYIAMKNPSKSNKSSNKFDLDDEAIEDYLDNISDKEDLFNMTKLKSILNLDSDGNDIDSSSDDSCEDDENWNLTKPKVKSKSKNKDANTKSLSPAMIDQLRVYNDKFTEFIKQKDVESIQIPPINNKIKSKVISLTKLYNLQCNQKTSKNRKKHLLIIKTPTSNYITEGVFLALCNLKNPKPYKLEVGKVNGKMITKCGNSGKEFDISVTRQSNPDRRIDEGNKGHKLLSKLGWTPGTSIGANNTGILDPIEAYKIKGRSGLGFN